MTKDQLIAAMRDHSLSPQAGEFSEREATDRIFGVFDHLSPRTARLVHVALLAGVEPAERDRVLSGEQLWSWAPCANPGPDLGIVNANDRVLAVFEHKRDARSNVTSYARFRGRRRFNDPVAQSLVIPAHTPGQHAPGECRGCEEHWHTGLRRGRFAAGMPQIDFYRCTPDRWVRPLKTGGNIHLPDPANVLWVLIDRYGRTADQAFPAAHTVAQWHTTGYDDMGPACGRHTSSPSATPRAEARASRTWAGHWKRSSIHNAAMGPCAACRFLSLLSQFTALAWPVAGFLSVGRQHPSQRSVIHQ